MSTKWQAYWHAYRNTEAASEEDLFVQVGKTVQRKPIPRDVFESMILRIRRQLELRRQDHLLDMCCGNGLVTCEVAPFVARVTAVDFAPHLIEAARTLKTAPNIDYRVGDVLEALDDLQGDFPGKLLMNDALAYFDPAGLARILDRLLSHPAAGPFRFLITGIPDGSRKWNFYDTPERREQHLANERAEFGVNDGLGRWWAADEIVDVCTQRRLNVLVEPQPMLLSRYRMDAVISNV